MCVFVCVFVDDLATTPRRTAKCGGACCIASGRPLFVLTACTGDVKRSRVWRERGARRFIVTVLRIWRFRSEMEARILISGSNGWTNLNRVHLNIIVGCVALLKIDACLVRKIIFLHITVLELFCVNGKSNCLIRDNTGIIEDAPKEWRVRPIESYCAKQMFQERQFRSTKWLRCGY